MLKSNWVLKAKCFDEQIYANKIFDLENAEVDFFVFKAEREFRLSGDIL